MCAVSHILVTGVNEGKKSLNHLSLEIEKDTH
jgi:hypothetical protein